MDVIKNLKINSLDINDFVYTSKDNNNLQLSDNVVLYNDGNLWKIIPLKIMFIYPIIYDQYAYSDEKYDVSIIVCPITLRSVMFKGKFKFYKYEDYRMIIQNSDDIMPIDLNYKISKNFIVQENKRIEVKILTLRSAITYAPDAHFINIKKSKINENEIVLNCDYYSNNLDIYGNEIKKDNIHPKTLVYIVYYKSHSTKKYKIAILIGNDYSDKNISGYDVIKSKINEYLIKNRSNIIKKNGYIMPMLWYMAKEIYKKRKIIYM